jgi:hypothetical protein
MKTIIQRYLGGLVLALCIAGLAISTNATARTARARIQQGIIQTIEPERHLLRLRAADQTALLTIVWDNRTRFFDNMRSVTDAELKKGMLVTVSYHTPFFGERFATKIVIERAVPGARSH